MTHKKRDHLVNVIFAHIRRKTDYLHDNTYIHYTHCNIIIKLLNVGSIRIYILMTGVVSNETNMYVRMYIEEFILVDIWIHCCTS